METKFQELKTRLLEINDISSAAGLLYWDQSTYMPPGGAAARGRQMATLSRLAHEKFVDPAVGKLLDELVSYEESLDYDSDEASMLRVTRREYERATKIPSEFLAEVTSHTSESYQVWTEARPANDFERMRPYLEKTLDYSRQAANFFPPNYAKHSFQLFLLSHRRNPPMIRVCTNTSQRKNNYHLA